VFLVKKISVILFVLAAGLVFFGILPKALAERLSRALLMLMVMGFVIRVGAYLLHQ